MDSLTGQLADVIVVGCGPTGALPASLLGALGVRVEVLERDAEVYSVPHATHVGEETLRWYAAAAN
jgi:2-polyprenyl-6-methoxyphenol hydroxylase-like FAD-dependent oxidoreductase